MAFYHQPPNYCGRGFRLRENLRGEDLILVKRKRSVSSSSVNHPPPYLRGLGPYLRAKYDLFASDSQHVRGNLTEGPGDRERGREEGMGQVEEPRQIERQKRGVLRKEEDASAGATVSHEICLKKRLPSRYPAINDDSVKNLNDAGRCPNITSTRYLLKFDTNQILSGSCGSHGQLMPFRAAQY
ncbi:hypothetical protein RUM44_008536 [Polyplax serrata]|uniref:Uncharacterized protein n=1 Tax=Polyplax serrata TaxID=468196 RepID=A0ABR1BCJ2_POLSC